MTRARPTRATRGHVTFGGGEVYQYDSIKITLTTVNIELIEKTYGY